MEWMLSKTANNQDTALIKQSAVLLLLLFCFFGVFLCILVKVFTLTK